jgi:hypothetical protein
MLVVSQFEFPSPTTQAMAALGEQMIFRCSLLIQKLNGEPKVFGWLLGDEQALLGKHGII